MRGSTWTNSRELVVGDLGTGTLAITGGGTVSSNDSWIGNEPGSPGQVTVDGGRVNLDQQRRTLRGPPRLRDAGDHRRRTGERRKNTNGLLHQHGNWRDARSAGGEADDSLTEFLDLVEGSDAIRYWDTSLAVGRRLPLQPTVRTTRWHTSKAATWPATRC